MTGSGATGPNGHAPAVGGVVLALLLLALPQLYGVGYPVMYQAFDGGYALWFLLLLVAGKMVAASLTIAIGGSGGVFAPSLFIGATSGMAFGQIGGHLFGPAAGQPALYGIVGMGAVFASAARGPLTALGSVVEMTGDFTLTLPVILAVAVSTTVSRALSYGTIYTTKLLRRGVDIERPTPVPAATPSGTEQPNGSGTPTPDGQTEQTPLLGSFTRQPHMAFGNDSPDLAHDGHTTSANGDADGRGQRSSEHTVDKK